MGLKDFIIAMAHKEDKVVVDVVGTKTLQNEAISYFKGKGFNLSFEGKSAISSS